jgi:hypothetical protein
VEDMVRPWSLTLLVEYPWLFIWNGDIFGHQRLNVATVEKVFSVRSHVNFTLKRTVLFRTASAVLPPLAIKFLIYVVRPLPLTNYIVF